MHQQWRNTKTEIQDSAFLKIEKLHPYKMILFLSMVGSSLIFMFMALAFWANSIDSETTQQFELPKIFTLGIIILILSSFSISKALSFFQADNARSLFYSLLITLGLGLFFALCQFIGWKQLDDLGIYPSGHSSRTYLYIISGLQLIHLLGCLIFLAMALSIAWLAKQDPVKNLMIVTDSRNKIKLEILTIYWHFLDISWVLLFLFFLFIF